MRVVFRVQPTEEPDGVVTGIKFLNGDMEEIKTVKTAGRLGPPEFGTERIMEVEPPESTAFIKVGMQDLEMSAPMNAYLGGDKVATFEAIPEEKRGPDRYEKWYWSDAIDVRPFLERPMVQAGLGIVGVAVATGFVGRWLGWW